MITKEISVEIRKSKNFQSYMSSETLTIEEGDNIEQLKKEAFSRCKEECLKQIEIDFPSKEKPKIIPPTKPTIIKG